jgi:plastocyanin
MKPDVRDRAFLPFIIPIGLLLVIAAVVIGLALLFLYVPHSIGLVIITMLAGGILAAFALESSQPEEQMTRVKRAVISLTVVGPIAIGVLVAVDVIPVDAEKMIDYAQPHVVIPEGAPVIVAVDILFDPEEFTLDAEQEMSVVVLDNQDAGIPHDLDIYPFGDDGEADLDAEPILQTDPFPGAATEVYEFETPEPGEYFFYCSVHPSTMTGTVTVE